MSERAVAVLTDSTWSLPPCVSDEHGITVVPLNVGVGTAIFDDVPENQEAIRALLTKNPTTSQPSRARLYEGYEQAAAGGARHVLAIHMSSKLSSTFETSRVAAEEFSAETGIPTTVIDSNNAAAALGLMVLAAVRTLDVGRSLEEALAAIQRVRDGSRVFLTVADLGHLHRGGRLSGAQMLVGSALGVRPILRVEAGEILLGESVRGEGRLRRRLIELAIEGGLDSERIMPGADFSDHKVDAVIHHAGDEDGAKRLAQSLQETAKARSLKLGTLEIAPMSGVLAAHTGPGAFGIVTAPSIRPGRRPWCTST